MNFEKLYQDANEVFPIEFDRLQNNLDAENNILSRLQFETFNKYQSCTTAPLETPKWISNGLYEAWINESITPKENTPLLPPPSTINAVLFDCIN